MSNSEQSVTLGMDLSNGTVEVKTCHQNGTLPRPNQPAGCFGLGRPPIAWRPVDSADGSFLMQPRVAQLFAVAHICSTLGSYRATPSGFGVAISASTATNQEINMKKLIHSLTEQLTLLSHPSHFKRPTVGIRYGCAITAAERRRFRANAEILSSDRPDSQHTGT